VFLLDQTAEIPFLTPEPGDIVVQGKADLGSVEGISGVTGAGVDVLVRQIGDRLAERADGAGAITRERQRNSILRALGAMDSALNDVSSGPERVEFAAEELRRACRALDSLLGRVDVEDLLDEIFASFCIGK
jgi:tRNA modification GTPase